MTARWTVDVPTDTTLTETVNLRTGHIRARGHLTRQGADLLSGTADHLRGNGHACVVLDLRGVRGADADGMDLLRSLRSRFAASGDRLIIENEPAGV